MALEDLRRERMQKLDRYEAAGRDPYPASVRRTFLIGDAVKKFSTLAKGKKSVSLVGRLRAMREHGGLAFGDLEDGSGSIQLSFSRDELEDGYDLVRDVLDIGDFLEVVGVPFKTKRGEPTIKVSVWRIIAKALRPLPEKWHGLKDVEERFRKRYLDLLMNAGVRKRFRTRTAIVREVRSALAADGFEEVETPVLQAMPGGAMARPFKTHHNALDVDLYLRIAPELYLKRLIVGGYERVYEFARVFRNEGIDATHNPEYTLLEFYAAYWNEQDMMDCVERLFSSVVRKVLRKSFLPYDGKILKLVKRFPRISFLELLKRHALITDYQKETADSLRLRAKQFGLTVQPGTPKGKIADEIFEKVCRPRLQDPVFVTDFSIDISPLSKRDDRNQAVVRRFNLIAGGQEIADGWAEVNDPRDQRRRFEAQEQFRKEGEEEAHPFDEEFIEALEYGMPPLAGVGVGIDRLVMLLTDTKNIREVVLFPTLRPK